MAQNIRLKAIEILRLLLIASEAGIFHRNRFLSLIFDLLLLGVVIANIHDPLHILGGRHPSSIQEKQSSEDGPHLKCLAHLNFKMSNEA